MTSFMLSVVLFIKVLYQLSFTLEYSNPLPTVDFYCVQWYLIPHIYVFNLWMHWKNPWLPYQKIYICIQKQVSYFQITTAMSLCGQIFIYTFCIKFILNMFLHIFLCLVKEQAIQVLRSISSSKPQYPKAPISSFILPMKVLSTMVFFRIITSMVSEGLLYLNKCKLWML